MIGLFLGTSEGRKLLENLNKFTDNIYISTATPYGGEIFVKYKYKHLNTSKLSQKDICSEIDKYNISIIIDGSHPYATELTDNLMEICKDKGVLYLRYERPPVVESYIPHPDIKILDNYEDLKENLNDILGVIINTTGSNNIEKFKKMNLPNRIIHKVLPIKEVITKLYYLNIPVKDIVAIYGGGSKDLNKALFMEYKAEAVILKDSGEQGKTKEKIDAALELGMKIFIINRKQKEYEYVFDNEKDIVDFVRQITKKRGEGNEK